MLVFNACDAIMLEHADAYAFPVASEKRTNESSTPGVILERRWRLFADKSGNKRCHASCGRLPAGRLTCFTIK